MDETLALPSEKAVKIALRTQQILANETGVPNTIDPLAGSYFIEDLTNKMEARAEEYFQKIDELGGVGGGTPNGDDIENYPLSDYSEDWAIIAPGGIETITLTGTGFMGYYIGGSHEYVIYVRSENEMTLRSIDGNDEFDWGFILIGE